MIDIHCHILPGIDDGPGDLQESLAMARLAVEDGVRAIVATPHCYDGVYNCQERDIVALCADFNTILQKEKIALTVFPGAEVRLSPEIPDAFEQGKVMTLADERAFLLLELPDIFIVEGVVRVINVLHRGGVRSIIAHPERNILILRKKEILLSLISAGAEIQLTGGSLAGEFGSHSRELACWILQLPVVSYLASDGHCLLKRKPVLAKAVKLAAKIIGHQRSLELVSFDLSQASLSTRNYA